MPHKSVLVPLAMGFEEVEALTPVDLLRRAGVHVTLAAIGADACVEGRSGIRVQTEVLLDAVSGQGVDLLMLPGGPGVALMRRHRRLGELVREFAASGRWLGAICAAPLVLLDAGLLAGRRYTAHDSTQAALPDALFDERVVRDGKLITSRGMGTALDFGLELVRVLTDDATAEKISRDIMA